LADEPSGNLDPGTSERLHHVITDLAAAEGQTFVVMTHDRDLAAGLGRHGHIEAGILQFESEEIVC
jgi:lipoprotein-releasing system ATP-binding protein